jgi:hypothetical protein
MASQIMALFSLYNGLMNLSYDKSSALVYITFRYLFLILIHNMSRESAFSAMDSSDMNTALNDYFGGLGRAKDPVDLMKENDERNEYNEKLLELTGAVGGPLIDQGLHGATHQLLKGVKYAIGRTGKSVLGQLGITPEKFNEYAEKYGLSDQTLKDLSEGKINLTKLAQGGLDQAFEKLGKASNIPTDLIRPGGPVLAEGRDAVNRGLAAAHSVASAAAAPDLEDLSSQPLKKSRSRSARTLRDTVSDARANLQGSLAARFGDDDIDLATRARRANVNNGKLLDSNVRTIAASSKLPLNIEDADPFSTGIDLPSDVKNKKTISGKTRNDGLGSVEIPEDWNPGKTPNMDIANRKQALREARRIAKATAAGKAGLDPQAAGQRAAARAQFLSDKTRPSVDAQFGATAQGIKADRDAALSTSNPFSIRVYDSPEATAARDALNNQISQAAQDARRAAAVTAENEKLRTILPDLSTLLTPASAAAAPDLPGIAGKSKIPVGPLEQGQEGYTRQQVKLLESKLPSASPTETNVAPTTKIATQSAPSEELEDIGTTVGGTVLGAAPSIALAAASPDQTPAQRAAAAGEAAGQEAGSALLSTVSDEAGLIPGVIAAAAEGGGTAAQRAQRGGIAAAEGEAPKAVSGLVRGVTSLSSAAETEGGSVGSTAVNTATKDTAQSAARAAAEAAGSETEDLGKTAAKALATTAETEGELGGPEDPIADIVSLGLGLGTLFGGLGGVEHQKLPTYRQPINPSVVYGI